MDQPFLPLPNGYYDTQRRCKRAYSLIDPGSFNYRCKKCVRAIADPNAHLGLCTACAEETADKWCQYCRRKLDHSQEQWGTGLCERCVNRLPQCKGCARRLKVTEMKFKTGLCDQCWASCKKSCLVCHEKISLGESGWKTAMCAKCSSGHEVKCKKCSNAISLEEIGWRTGICNRCYDNIGGCRSAVSSKRPHIRLCDPCYKRYNTICVRCNQHIPVDELRYTSGLCDFCYKDCDKKCSSCSKKIPLKQLRWGSGLCDSCYNKSRMACCMCSTEISTEQTEYHGVRLCSDCFKLLTDAEKTCFFCNNNKLLVGDPYWAIGMCQQCYESTDLTHAPSVARTRKTSRARAHSLHDLRLSPFYSARLRRTGRALTLYSAKSKCLLPDLDVDRGILPLPQASSPLRLWFLFLALGVSGWFPSNAVFAALPLLVEEVPEGAAIASLVNASTQIGAVFAIVFHVIEYNKDLEIKASVAETMSKMSVERQMFKELQQRKKAAQQAARAIHKGQAVAVAALAMFMLSWGVCKATTELILLAAVAGAVGNVADLTAWPVALQHPSRYAAAIQIGGSVSGVLPNFIEAVIGNCGILAYLLCILVLQLALWVTISTKDVAGLPPDEIQPFAEKATCNCAGCDGCNFDGGSATTAASVGGAASPVTEEEEETSSTDDDKSIGVAEMATRSITRFYKALRGDQDSLSEGGQSLVAFYTSCSFVSRAMCYSIPSLLPFIANPFGVRRQELYESMNTMYNVGNFVGRMLCQFYKPHTFGLACSLGMVILTFVFLVLCSVFPEDVAVRTSAVFTAWIIPLIVGLFNLSVGLMSTGLFIRAHEDAQSKKCPDTIQATMGFYGQIGCVSGNLFIFLIINVFHLL
ncbi:unnamed protein product [Effrenium voratum]|uniref:Uncharacterized protein n=1 Tax=Effrenium voratum TaxID=2562239 RepID=A0AA36HR69_9DINO|nr:unnamed protein product [Effrenium voratum]CAJ1435419.1 unnamed protein product [Effrenium voratum]